MGSAHLAWRWVGLSNFVHRFVARLLQCWAYKLAIVVRSGGKHKYVGGSAAPLPCLWALCFPSPSLKMISPLPTSKTQTAQMVQHGQIYGSRGLSPLGSTSVGTVLLLNDVLDFNECVR